MTLAVWQHWLEVFFKSLCILTFKPLKILPTHVFIISILLYYELDVKYYYNS